MSDTIIIFCDGSSRGNPGPGGWGAIVSMHGKVSELGAAEAHTTNNKVELLAAIHALRLVGNADKEIAVNTDSAYVVNGMTKWIFGWQKNGWKTVQKDSVSNRDLWEALIAAAAGKKIKWNRVPGHAGVPGNERCDAIATGFADGVPPALFRGKSADYPVDLSVLAPANDDPARKSGAAYSYVSMVDGVIETHPTWAECEARVKGASGAKFKKARNADEERRIVAAWES
ncbi:MAG: ribonuclease HI [Patescibacteria group bacterium]|nr:ribonuclease HI [Patescibacteria group bacterium]MDE1945678.1 ribonuclease HI [Patescibacteria group bacterium]